MNRAAEPPTIWDTTSVRHLAIAQRVDLLVVTYGLRVPRAVADPTDPTGRELLRRPAESLSEIANAEGYFLRRALRDRDVVAGFDAERLQDARQHPDLMVIDLDEDEAEDAAVFGSDEFALRMGLVGPLGRGEAAVLAVAQNREWTAGIDEDAARSVAESYRIPVVTTQDAIRTAVRTSLISRQEAEALNDRLIAGGFRGPPRLLLP